MSFDLKALPFGTTLNRQIARQHLTRFNNVYWVAERGYRHNRAAFPNIRMPPRTPEAHGVFADAAAWEKAADEHHVWVRQHILVSAAALLEVYVKAASVTAVNVWRIWLLFYGSFFLAAATILYTVYCPAEVKAYQNGYAMAELEAKHYVHMNEGQLIQNRVKWLYDHMPRWMYSYFDSSGLNFTANVNGMYNPDGFLSKFFVHQWMILDMWYRGLRCCLYVLYVVGLALIAVPAFFTFLQVTWIPVKHALP